MNDKDSSARLSYLLGEMTRNDDTGNESEKTPVENSQEPSETNMRASILTQENSVISIPSALQHVIDLQNEQLGINDPGLNRNNQANENQNTISRKRRRTNSHDSESSISSKSSLSSLGSMRTRLLAGNAINNNNNNKESLPSGSLFNSSNNSTNFLLGDSTVNVNSKDSAWDPIQTVVQTLSISDPSLEETNQRLFHERSGQFYTITSDTVPTFNISSNVFNSPIEFFDKTSDIGQKYGCVKLKFIDGNLTDNISSNSYPTLFNFDTFSFRCRKQKLASEKVMNRRALVFYHNLYTFSRNQSKTKININKLPNVNGKPFNLYELFRIVKINGGFKSVQKNNLWIYLSKQLDYRDSSNQQSTLEQIYKDFLLDFDCSQFNEDKSSRNRSDDIKTVYELNSIGVDYPRIKDMKIAKHLQTNDQSTSDSKFNNDQWQSWFPLYDNDKYTAPCSSKYNVKEYFDLSQQILQQLLDDDSNYFPTDVQETRSLSLDQFEKLYFDVLSSENTDLNIYNGVSLSSSIHKVKSRNPTLTEEQMEKNLDRWNLTNVPLDNDSYLKFLDFDKGDYTSSRYSAGMVFSTSGWSVNDSFLPSVDYQHLGSSKIWYVVPPEYFEKFEEYLQKVSADVHNSKNASNNSEHFGGNRMFESSSLFQVYKSNKQDHCDSNNRLSTYKDFIFKDISKGNEPPLILSDLQINPEILREQGIKVYRICQETGSYVFQYPKCYTSTIGTDFYLSESVYFIPKSISFNCIEAGSNWLASRNNLPGINYFALLVNIAQYSKEVEVVEKVKRFLIDIVDSELNERSQAFKHFPNLESIENKFDFISDYSLKNTGFSKVVIKYQNTTMTLSLSEFLHHLDFADNNDWILFDIPLVHIRVTVHLYYPDNFFFSLLNKINNPLVSTGINDPLLEMTLEEKVSMILVEKYDDVRVPSNVLENLLRDTKVYDDYYYVVRGLIDKSYSLLSKCKKLWLEMSVAIESSKPNLDAFEKNPITTLNKPQVTKVMDKLNNLVKDIIQSSVTFPEMEYFLQLYKIYQEFSTKVEQAVASNKLKLMEKVYLESFEIPLDQEHSELLINSICRFKWSDIYYELFVSFDVSEALIAQSLTFLYDFLNYGLKYCQEEDIPKLRKVKERIILCQKIFKKVESIITSSRNGESVSIKDINRIVEQIDKERLPIPSNLKKTLMMISDCISDTNTEQNPLITQMSGNKSYVERMDDYIRGNSMESFQYFPKFNGSSQDKRITIKDAQGKATLVDRVADYKAWYAEMRRITNNQSIVTILKSAKTTLDLVNDKYVEPGIEQASTKVKYCFCRADEGTTMIECDICRDWYHTECVGGKGWKFSNNDNSIFVCPICDVNGNTVIHKPNAVNFGDLKRSVLDTVYLEVIPDKRILQQYFELYKIALTFRNSMFEILFIDGDINKDVPISLVKYYLRKAEKSQIEFIDLVGPLKRYCHAVDKPQFESFNSKNLTIITV